MTYPEWRAWTEFEGKSEWVDGEVIVFMSATPRHTFLSAFLVALLSTYVWFRDLGEVGAETLEMFLGDRGRQPDVLFIAKQHLPRLTAQRLDGPADLVIELVSADSVERDYKEKYKEYAAAGVREYWIVETRPGATVPISTTSAKAPTSRYSPTRTAAFGRR